MNRTLLLLSLLIGLVLGCHEKQEVSPPPPPLRPEPEPGGAKNQQKDCEPIDPASELKPLSFDERSIPEGTRLAEQGRAKLRSAESADSAESAELKRATRETQITEAVSDLLTALAADPYNVDATYNLAAAYARIGRKQCAINLLTRLLQMRPHPSKHADVEVHLDRLLGRKQALDPDFAEMRRDDRFRALIQKLCEGTNDPNCVYGNRER
jgi:tetratricopeptide (TPR) repeat protein